jgi:hypothetical protein
MVDVRRHLRRFWFRFDGPSLPPGVGHGCGVTAFDRDDAEQLLRDTVFGGEPLPDGHVTEDVDVSALDPHHVAPNMGDATLRGVWFPRTP